MSIFKRLNRQTFNLKFNGTEGSFLLREFEKFQKGNLLNVDNEEENIL